AEDGIRGFHVTGVQTCALPISFFACQKGLQPAPRLTLAYVILRIFQWPCAPETDRVPRRLAPVLHLSRSTVMTDTLIKVDLNQRSEERRVGKESRSAREWNAAV